jgi:predicted nucleic acid-binding protein
MAPKAKAYAGVVCLVDTDIIIDYLRRRAYAATLLTRWAEDGLLCVSSLTHFEVYHGMKPAEEPATNAFLDGLVSVAVDVPIARRAGDMLNKLRSKGVTVGMADSIIAATAIILAVPLLTNNVAHYPFAGLELVRGVC